MIADHKVYRLYREIMREAVSLGDRFIVEIALMRINNFAQPPAADTKPNIISFPIEHLVSAPDLKERQKLWVTVLLTAMIPLGITLFIVAFHYLTLGFTIPCQS